jgi:hypothetical protein
MFFAVVYALPLLRFVNWGSPISALNIPTLDLDFLERTPQRIPNEVLALDGRRVKFIGDICDPPSYKNTPPRTFHITAIPRMSWHIPYVGAYASPKGPALPLPPIDPFAGASVITGIFHIRNVKNERPEQRSPEFSIDAEQVGVYIPSPVYKESAWIGSIHCASIIGCIGTLLLMLRAARVAWRLRVHGCCPESGYDLRATPERCPECGRVNPEAYDQFLQKVLEARETDAPAGKRPDLTDGD